MVVERPYRLREEAPPQSLCVGLQRAEALSRPQQREQSIVRMAEVLHYLPGLGPAPLAVDRVQVRELGADDALS